MSDHGSRATGLIKARHFRIFGGGFALAANLSRLFAFPFGERRVRGQIPKQSQGTLKVARVKTTESEPFALARRWLGGEGSAGRLETVYRIGGAQASRQRHPSPGAGLVAVVSALQQVLYSVYSAFVPNLTDTGEIDVT